MVHCGVEGGVYKHVLEQLGYHVRVQGGYVIAGPKIVNWWWESEYTAGDGGWS